MFHFIFRHKKISFLILSVAILAIVAIVRWQIWFHNPKEKPYTVIDEPQWILLTPGNHGEMSRNVSWVCGDEVLKSKAELVAVAECDTSVVMSNGEVFASRAGKTAYYHVEFTDLKPDTEYAYRVTTGGKQSKWYNFMTFPENRERFSFLYVGDVQDTIGGTTNKTLREALSLQPETELLVCGGDLTERPTYQYWEETFRSLDSICQATPVMNITGNHDYIKGVICKLERRFPLIFSYFLRSKVEDNMVYTTTYGNTQFFLLDSNREFFYLFSQRSWLEEQLKASNAKWKIVVVHHPLYSIKGNNYIQKWFFNDLIQDYGVDLVLQGHEHAYARRTNKDEEGNSTTPVYTISHCSPKNYQIDFDDDFDKYGINSRYYQTVDIKGDTMALATYDANTHELYDTLEVIKTDEHTSINDLGADIKENITYKVNPSSDKSLEFFERIEEYKNRHPERM